MNRDFKGIWIPKEIWLDPSLSIMEKVFLVEILSLDNEEGCFASNSYFADFFGISKSRCTQIVTSLKDKELITVELERVGKAITKRTIRGGKFTKQGGKYIKQGGKYIKQGGKYSKHPYLENCEYNNTSINNTSNNKKIQKSESVENSIPSRETIPSRELETSLQEFEEFRKLYPGRKRGLQEEFKTFKKHKDYRECIHLLITSLEGQIKFRKIEQAKGEFVPSWKNLSTWLNQRCWTEEITQEELSEEEMLELYRKMDYKDFKELYGSKVATHFALICE